MIDLNKQAADIARCTGAISVGIAVITADSDEILEGSFSLENHGTLLIDAAGGATTDWFFNAYTNMWRPVTSDTCFDEQVEKILDPGCSYFGPYGFDSGAEIVIRCYGVKADEVIPEFHGTLFEDGEGDLWIFNAYTDKWYVEDGELIIDILNRRPGDDGEVFPYRNCFDDGVEEIIEEWGSLYEPTVGFQSGDIVRLIYPEKVRGMAAPRGCCYALGKDRFINLQTGESPRYGYGDTGYLRLDEFTSDAFEKVEPA